MKLIKLLSRPLLMLSLVFLTGCVAQLAPKYDQALFEGITSTNVQVMQLFASVSSGTDRKTCTERANAYNSVIGAIDALALQSKARPMPDSSSIDKINDYLSSKGFAAIVGNEPPSTNALEEVSKNLTKMKQTDCKIGLQEPVVATFKNAVSISMDQAITYESFLNR
ncbi:hypothetical protein FLM48_09490 [Shewanella sp. Scap07]|uniref:hypothetical protein n=1 Tax=Shewanella sp. Scap07 TaxID=2589987 RepID=UPI0015BC10B9|nr:hypothetical protein [Shewanella sp. Scap07]QLE85298.1 hypothetical protein FLM48_09490 [Shewanella sp. Scap07]